MSTTTRASSAQPDGRDARWAAHRVARRLKFVPEEVDTWVRERNAAKTSAQILAAQAAPPAPDPDWVAAQVAQAELSVSGG